jgi:ssDNA-binding Zn-finger/Zn-ribbon topoisomerase 1
MYLERLINQWKAEGIYELPNRDKHQAKRCGACGTGIMVERNGKYGIFWGCSNYPRCRGSH